MAGTFSVTKQLFVRCAAGFAPACEEAFEAVRPVLQKIARRLAFQFGSYDESEDLLQEIYLKLTANRENLAGGTRIGSLTWPGYYDYSKY